MTLDSQLRQRLTSAVDDTAVPPGLAHAAMAGGRRRRARRTAGVVALASAAVVGGLLLVPQHALTNSENPVVADGAPGSLPGLEWARSLPEGAAPELPFFGEGGLWSGGRQMSVPASVNTTVAPQLVAGGWLVFVERDGGVVAWAVLSSNGSLRELPVGPTADGRGPARVVVSADGDQVAYADRVVDLDTMAVTELPHAPRREEPMGYSTGIRMIGFSDQGLVYEGAPFDQGAATTWLWGADGSTTEIQPPTGTDVPDGPRGDVALRFDATADGNDTCTTSYALQAGSWVENGSGCMGRELGEVLTLSPGHHWLVTDDLPQVWDLHDSAWRTVEMPRDVARAQVDAQKGGVVWEDDNSFLLAVADRWAWPNPPTPTFDQQVQIVRCLMSTGRCQRAGDEQDVRVRAVQGAPSQVGFAGP